MNPAIKSETDYEITENLHENLIESPCIAWKLIRKAALICATSNIMKYIYIE